MGGLWGVLGKIAQIVLPIIVPIVVPIVQKVVQAFQEQFQQQTGGGSPQAQPPAPQPTSPRISEEELLEQERRREEQRQRERELQQRERELQQRERELQQREIGRDISQTQDYQALMEEWIRERVPEEGIYSYLNFLLLNGRGTDEDENPFEAFGEVWQLITESLFSHAETLPQVSHDSGFTSASIEWIHNNLANEILGQADPFASDDASLLEAQLIEQIASEANYYSIDLGDLQNKNADEVLYQYLTELQKARFENPYHEEMLWQIEFWQGLTDTFHADSPDVTTRAGFGTNNPPYTDLDTLIEMFGRVEGTNDPGDEHAARSYIIGQLGLLNDEYLDPNWSRMSTADLAAEWRYGLRAVVPRDYKTNADYLNISPTGRDVLQDIQTLRALEGLPLVPPPDYSILGEVALFAMSFVPGLDQFAAGISLVRSVATGDWGGAGLDLIDFLPGPNRSSGRRVLGFADNADELGDAGHRLDNVNDLNHVTARVDSGKYEYLFGQVASNVHNEARSQQLLREMERVGIFNNNEGRTILLEHFEDILRDANNIVDSYSNEHGIFEVRQALLQGPNGKYISLETTWEVLEDGTRRFITAIPRRGADWTSINP